MRRAGLTQGRVELHSLGLVDRFGIVHLPFEGAETVARSFAAGEPTTVLIYIQDQGDEMNQRGYTPGDRIYHQLLREYGPGFALARQSWPLSEAPMGLDKRGTSEKPCPSAAAGQGGVSR